MSDKAKSLVKEIFSRDSGAQGAVVRVRQPPLCRFSLWVIHTEPQLGNIFYFLPVLASCACNYYIEL